MYRTLAAGGAGLIITGHTAVHAQGVCRTGMNMIHSDSLIVELKKVARAVHEVAEDSKILLQLSHAGRQVFPETALDPIAPSAVYDTLYQRTPREMTREQIENMIQCFVDSIRRAREAEFDGVQLHAAHGWLLSSFVSPHTNRRQDAFGGNTENRFRMIRIIVEQGQKRVGADYPILIKMNTEDLFPGGMNIEEAKSIAQLCESIGVAAIEASGSIWECMTRTHEELGFRPVPIPEARVGIKTKNQEAYFWRNAKEIRKVTRLPIILVGGIKSIDVIEAILAEGSVDFCAMSRPLIREPDLPNRWLSGDGGETALCISCNKCLQEEGLTHCAATRE
jgi:2,4-dienoyl-CoA reductase-like NADH-dependent reductase (Old Yellow Enzyme family)